MNRFREINEKLKALEKSKVIENHKIELRKLWFIFGNNGCKSTKGNHSYIQGFIEYNEDRKDFYLKAVNRMGKEAITEECINAVEKIIK